MTLGEPLDGALGAHRHEDGRRDVAVGGMENSGAGPSLRALREEFKGNLAGQLSSVSGTSFTRSVYHEESQYGYIRFGVAARHLHSDHRHHPFRSGCDPRLSGVVVLVAR